MAVYMALTDLYLPGDRLVQAGTQFSDTGPGALVPGNWPPPTGAVDARDPDATQKIWNQGPRGQFDAEPNRATYTNSGRWSDVAVPAAKLGWVSANPAIPAYGFILKGGGENYGTHPTV